MGLFDFLAPRKDENDPNNNNKKKQKKRTRKNRQQRGKRKDPNAGGTNIDNDHIVNNNDETKEQDNRKPAAKKAKEPARIPLSAGHFVKKQKVQYHHRGTNTFHDATVVGVHYDDGPDKPYYVSVLIDKDVLCKHIYIRLCVCVFLFVSTIQ